MLFFSCCCWCGVFLSVSIYSLDGLVYYIFVVVSVVPQRCEFIHRKAYYSIRMQDWNLFFFSFLANFIPFLFHSSNNSCTPQPRITTFRILTPHVMTGFYSFFQTTYDFECNYARKFIRWKEWIVPEQSNTWMS